MSRGRRRDQAEPLSAGPARLLREGRTHALSGRLDLLVRLGSARDAGVLTDGEFCREKDRLLSA